MANWLVVSMVVVSSLARADPRLPTGGEQDPPRPGPHPVLSFGKAEALDDTTLTAGIVVAKVQSAYVPGLRRCYKEHLDHEPKAHGSLVLAFTVASAGRTRPGNSTAFASDIEGCASAVVSSWRFPIPKDKRGEPTDARFTIALELSVRP